MKSVIERVVFSPRFYVLFAVGMIPVHLWGARATFAWEHRLLSWALLIPFLVSLHLFKRAGAESVPLFPMVTFQLYVAYGLAVLSQDHLVLVYGPYLPPRDSVTEALVLVLLGSVLFLFMVSAGAFIRQTLRLPYSRVFPEPNPFWTRFVLVLSTLAVVNYFLFEAWFQVPLLKGPLEAFLGIH